MLSNKLKTTFFLIALALHSIILLKQVKFEMFNKNPKTAQVEKRVRLKLRKPVQPKPDKKPKQIVNTQKQKNKSRPKKAKYLSHSNQSFERETVAAKTGRYKDAGKGTSRKKTPSSMILTTSLSTNGSCFPALASICLNSSLASLGNSFFLKVGFFL